jgi:hypothetical protein
MFSSEWGVEGQVDGDVKMKWGAIMLGKGYVFFLLFFFRLILLVLFSICTSIVCFSRLERCDIGIG